MSPEEVAKWSTRLAPLRVTACHPERRFHAKDPALLAERLTLFFESRENLQKHLSRYAGFSPNTRQADDVAACLQQGREFLRISRDSHLVTKPITLYYGMACYAKALALSFRNPQRLAHFPPRHGLTAPSDFGLLMHRLEVGVDGTDGLFHRFVASLGEEAGTTAETRLGNKFWVRTGHGDATRLTFRSDLKGLLARILGVEDFYRETFDECSLNTLAQFKVGIIAEAAPPQGSLILDLPHGNEVIQFALARSCLPRCQLV